MTTPTPADLRRLIAAKRAQRHGTSSFEACATSLAASAGQLVPVLVWRLDVVVSK